MARQFRWGAVDLALVASRLLHHGLVYVEARAHRCIADGQARQLPDHAEQRGPHDEHYPEQGNDLDEAEPMSWGSAPSYSTGQYGRLCEIRIKETLAQLDKGGLRTDTPKSQAGKRTVAFPAEIAPEIRWHLERFAEPGDRGFVFIGPKGGKLRRSNFHKSVWSKIREQVGLPGLHFHDLRHTGGTLSAATGATLKELMARLGHSSVRASMIYQHATRDRDQAIAKALGTFNRDVQNATEKPADNPERGEKGAWAGHPVWHVYGTPGPGSRGTSPIERR
jgi:hypothetical protein